MAQSFVLFFLFLVLPFFAASTLEAKRKTVEFYEFGSSLMTVNITNWGATIQSIRVQDSKGKFSDVVLGFDGIGPYITDNNYFGGVVGRVANKIGNAEFTLNGTAHHLFHNSGNDSLHGGNRGFNKVIWEVAEDKRNVSVPFMTFHYRSSDGEQGFPGALDVFVTYEMYEDDELSVYMNARPVNKPTPINLAQHVCWNLGGHDSGSILHHQLRIAASRMVQVDGGSLLPTGKIVPVRGTPFDFESPAEVGSRFSNGYDDDVVVDYVVDRKFEGTIKVAEVEDRRSGRVLQIWSNQPALQFHTLNPPEQVKGKGGHYYGKHSGLCLAGQGFPDAVNHPNFPSQVYSPGQTYHQSILYSFSAKI